MNDRAQDRPVKQDEQQKNGGQPDEEPADPTSAATRSDSALSIFAHESDTLNFPPSNRNRSPLCAHFLDERSCQLSLRFVSLAAESMILTEEFLTTGFADFTDEVNDLQELS